VLREPKVTPATKRTQQLRGVCDGATVRREDRQEVDGESPLQ
jgi:hypothetical protein